jgi:hypothetical protein
VLRTMVNIGEAYNDCAARHAALAQAASGVGK